MPIGPAQLASSLGALDGLEVDQGLEVTLPQVLRSAKTLLDADRAALMLTDQAGASATGRLGSTSSAARAARRLKRSVRA